MRILNRNEQDLCLRILNGHGRNNYLGNIIDHKLDSVCISVTRDTKIVELEFAIHSGGQFPTDAETEEIIGRINEISLDILEVVNLINILEKDGYIMLLQKANQVSNYSMFGRCIGNMNCVTHHFADEKISDLLIQYVNKEIYVTDEFREFCRHGFIARDEQRFRRQNRNAIIAISIAMFAVLTNLFYNAWTKLSDGTKIKQEQIDSITSGLKSIETKFDTLNVTTKNLHLSKPIDKQLTTGTSSTDNGKTKR
ncbi:MAG: hypothetical protein WC868_10305 [Bacteroidales bacterium]